MPGKAPTTSFCPVDIEQVDLGRLSLKGGVGDLLGRGAETGRQHQIPPGGQQFHIEAVLVHDRQALNPLVLGARFVDEHDPGVEIALLAGDSLVDGVGNDMADAARILRPGEELLARELLPGEDVP